MKCRGDWSYHTNSSLTFSRELLLTLSALFFYCVYFYFLLYQLQTSLTDFLPEEMRT